MKFETFAVEKWMDEHETTAKYDLAETSCACISLTQLASMADQPIPPESIIDLNLKQDYGDVRGSSTLRANLASLYSAKAPARLSPDNILITPGAIAANYVVFAALLGPGDHVICHYPTYQQLYEVPKMMGAEVDLWRAKARKDWVPDIEDLKELVKENTKMIIINNPHNPTGVVLKKSLMEKILEVAKEKDIIVLSDEVYRPVFHSILPVDEEFPPSLLSMPYDKAIVTGSLSKAYALAGIRTGWIASRTLDIIDACSGMRRYMTISVGKTDQAIAAFALSSLVMHGLLSRNIKLAKTNLALVEKFVNNHSSKCEWTRPLAGTTAFIRFEKDGDPIDATEFCKKLQEETGVLLLPGDFGFGKEFKGYVRIGFCCETKVLEEGLELLADFMRGTYKSLPTV